MRAWVLIEHSFPAVRSSRCIRSQRSLGNSSWQGCTNTVTCGSPNFGDGESVVENGLLPRWTEVDEKWGYRLYPPCNNWLNVRRTTKFRRAKHNTARKQPHQSRLRRWRRKEVKFGVFFGVILVPFCSGFKGAYFQRSWCCAVTLWSVSFKQWQSSEQHTPRHTNMYTQPTTPTNEGKSRKIQIGTVKSRLWRNWMPVSSNFLAGKRGADTEWLWRFTRALGAVSFHESNANLYASSVSLKHGLSRPSSFKWSSFLAHRLVVNNHAILKIRCKKETGELAAVDRKLQHAVMFSFFSFTYPLFWSFFKNRSVWNGCPWKFRYDYGFLYFCVHARSDMQVYPISVSQWMCHTWQVIASRLPPATRRRLHRIVHERDQSVASR